MCGIAGFSGTDVRPETARPVLQRMIHTLAHRGPDGFGFHAAAGVALAHARLSVIDLVTGDQPMRHPEQDIWTVFNGEIFNFIELRRELERDGHRFRTRSDTEVIVHLYQRDGDRFVEQLNGQFAIALWDGPRRRLLLARDRAGIRPLFHARGQGRFWFASEAKALLPVLPGCRALDPLALAQALTYWSTPDPGTIFQGIRSLPPGCLLAIEADGRETSTRYWDWQFPPAARTSPSAQTRSVEDATAELRALLVDAVRLQLRADVPVAAYLSGGLDSSGIVALARRFTDAPVRTFSVAFGDSEFDESVHQQAMARHLGTEHTTVHCSRRDIGEAFPRLVRHAEAPVLRTGPVPLMLLSARVRQCGYKVALTGEGADEVFGGYDLFKEAKVRRFWAREPGSQLRPRLLGRLYGYLRHSPVEQPGMAEAFFGQGLEHIDRPVFAHVPRWSSGRRARSLLAAPLQALLAGWDPLRDYESTLPDAIMSWSPLARDQYVEARTLLAGYLLSSQGDRAAMANSVEGRYPYLDHRLIEFGAALPPSWKIRGLTEKYLLRRALAGLLPDDIVHRTKQPYRAPDSQSFFADGEPLDYVAELMGAPRIRDAGYFDPVAVGRLLDKARAGRVTGFADNQAFVGVLSTMLVHQQLVDAAAPVASTAAGRAQPTPALTG
jgi:asparagine synthase (glutamine-hydrolysing)